MNPSGKTWFASWYPGRASTFPRLKIFTPSAAWKGASGGAVFFSRALATRRAASARGTRSETFGYGSGLGGFGRRGKAAASAPDRCPGWDLLGPFGAATGARP